ncbi:hypothetical protein [Escherichia coli]|uniref:hypothetical protein n=1 Tax=Escherichia coli TaxID=562 RepID=UPI0020235B00|nr:hypothetical protein [Escherichia coli]
MWLGALITSLLFVAAHSQYQNLLTLAELFLVGLIYISGQDSEVVACCCRYYAAYGSNTLGLLFWLKLYFY